MRLNILSNILTFIFISLKFGPMNWICPTNWICPMNLILCHVLLTSACCEDSNIYGLENTLCIRDLTAVDSIHSTSPADHTYHTRTPDSVKVPHKILCIDNHVGKSSSIGEEPAPQGSSTIGTSATSN